MNDFNQLLLTALVQEKDHEIRNGIYGFTQREFAYNSNLFIRMCHIDDA